MGSGERGRGRGCGKGGGWGVEEKVEKGEKESVVFFFKQKTAYEITV